MSENDFDSETIKRKQVKQLIEEGNTEVLGKLALELLYYRDRWVTHEQIGDFTHHHRVYDAARLVMVEQLRDHNVISPADAIAEVTRRIKSTGKKIKEAKVREIMARSEYWELAEALEEWAKEVGPDEVRRVADSGDV
ncbi:MAG: hypothetical protein ACWA5Q_06205 [bacterium]